MVPGHCLYHLLPPVKSFNNLRQRGHNFMLTDCCNSLQRHSFIIRCLFDFIWFICLLACLLVLYVCFLQCCLRLGLYSHCLCIISYVAMLSSVLVRLSLYNNKGLLTYLNIHRDRVIFFDSLGGITFLMFMNHVEWVYT